MQCNTLKASNAWEILLYLCFFANFFIPGLQTCAYAAPPAVTKVSGWVQEKYLVAMGKTTSICTNQGYVFSNPQSGFNVMCVPPSWSVTAISPKKKLFFVFSDGHTIKPGAGLGLMSALSMDFDPSQAKWDRIGSKNYLGHPTEIWRAKKRADSPDATKDSFDGFEFWLAKDIPIPHSLSQCQSKTNGYPSMNYLALRFLRLRPRRKPQVFLDTISLKPITVPTSMFRLPSGYKETASDRDIATHTGELQTMLDGLGLGDEKK